MEECLMLYLDWNQATSCTKLVEYYIFYLFIFKINYEKIFTCPSEKGALKINEERWHFKCHLSRMFSGKVVVLFGSAGSAVCTF
jgi:hypothetical protein